MKESKGEPKKKEKNFKVEYIMFLIMHNLNIEEIRKVTLNVYKIRYQKKKKKIMFLEKNYVNLNF